MPLFQNSVVTKYLQSQNKTNLESKWDLYKNHFLNPKVQESIKVEPYQTEREDYFIEESKKGLELKAAIDTTDKEIDAMVYELYGLSEEEIGIVEKS
jgi:hypothetical protein